MQTVQRLVLKKPDSTQLCLDVFEDLGNYNYATVRQCVGELVVYECDPVVHVTVWFCCAQRRGNLLGDLGKTWWKSRCVIRQSNPSAP